MRFFKYLEGVSFVAPAFRLRLLDFDQHREIDQLSREYRLTLVKIRQHLRLILSQCLYYPAHEALISRIEHPHDYIRIAHRKCCLVEARWALTDEDETDVEFAPFLCDLLGRGDGTLFSRRSGTGRSKVVRFFKQKEYWQF